MGTLVSIFFLGAFLGALAMIVMTDSNATTAWRYEELVSIVGKRKAGKLWHLVVAGQLSLFDIKNGVYTVKERTKMQSIFEAYHADIS